MSKTGHTSEIKPEKQKLFEPKKSDLYIKKVNIFSSTELEPKPLSTSLDFISTDWDPPKYSVGKIRLQSNKPKPEGDYKSIWEDHPDPIIDYPDSMVDCCVQEINLEATPPPEEAKPEEVEGVNPELESSEDLLRREAKALLKRKIGNPEDISVEDIAAGMTEEELVELIQFVNRGIPLPKNKERKGA